MDLIDAVNICLTHAHLGTVNAIGDGDERAATAVNIIRRQRRRILTHGFDFNTTRVELKADTTGRVPVPQSYLKMYLPRYLSVRLDDNGQKYLWHHTHGTWAESSMEDKTSIVHDVEEFQGIPEPFGSWIAWHSAGDFYVFQKNADRPSAYVSQMMIDAEAEALNTIVHPSIEESPAMYRDPYYSNKATVLVGHLWVVV